MKLLCVIGLRYKDQLWSSLTHTHIHIHILKTHTNIYRKNLLTHMHLKYKHTHTHTHSKPFTLTHPPPSLFSPTGVCMYICWFPPFPHPFLRPTYIPTPLTFPLYGGRGGKLRHFSVGLLRVLLRQAPPPPLALPATISCTVNMYNGAGWCL